MPERNETLFGCKLYHYLLSLAPYLKEGTMLLFFLLIFSPSLTLVDENNLRLGLKLISTAEE